MSYIIKPYTKKQAEKLNVQIKPSRTKGKKIDVFKNGKKIASVGAAGMKDYPTYLDLENKGKVETGTAAKRRKLYKIRHENDRKKRNSNGFYADKLLW